MNNIATVCCEIWNNTVDRLDELAIFVAARKMPHEDAFPRHVGDVDRHLWTIVQLDPRTGHDVIGRRRERFMHHPRAIHHRDESKKSRDTPRIQRRRIITETESQTRFLSARPANI